MHSLPPVRVLPLAAYDANVVAVSLCIPSFSSFGIAGIPLAFTALLYEYRLSGRIVAVQGRGFQPASAMTQVTERLKSSGWEEVSDLHKVYVLQPASASGPLYEPIYIFAASPFLVLRSTESLWRIPSRAFWSAYVQTVIRAEGIKFNLDHRTVN